MHITKRIAVYGVLLVWACGVALALADGECAYPVDEKDTAVGMKKLEECAATQETRAVADHDAAYAALVLKLDPAGKTALAHAEQSWLAYRDSNCAFITRRAQGSSVFPILQLACLTDMTQERTKRLRSAALCKDGGKVECIGR